MTETKNINNNLDNIPEMPVFRPTEAEFSNPINYVEKLMNDKKVQLYGCVKIIPPESFKPS